MSQEEAQDSTTLKSGKKLSVRPAPSVAAAWVALTAIAQVFVATVLVHKLPSSVFVFVLGASGMSHPLEISTSTLMVVGWSVIGGCAVIVALAALLQRRLYLVSVSAGFLVSGILPFFAASTLVSLFAQVGLVVPADSFSLAAIVASGVVGGVFLILGFASYSELPRWWRSRQNKQGRETPIPS